MYSTSKMPFCHLHPLHGSAWHHFTQSQRRDGGMKGQEGLNCAVISRDDPFRPEGGRLLGWEGSLSWWCLGSHHSEKQQALLPPASPISPHLLLRLCAGSSAGDGAHHAHQLADLPQLLVQPLVWDSGYTSVQGSLWRLPPVQIQQPWPHSRVRLELT